tara:strand:- start:256 stop:513 length:258 start_codon:yes stop_codon:yes gene_type:complete
MTLLEKFIVKTGVNLRALQGIVDVIVMMVIMEINVNTAELLPVMDAGIQVIMEFVCVMMGGLMMERISVSNVLIIIMVMIVVCIV